LTLSELSFTVREVFFSFGHTGAMSPSDTAWQQLISALHSSGRKAALAITGGGSGAVSELLRVPGGSRLLIEAQIPYDERALAAFLGFAPVQACSADTTIAMARAARARAASLVPVGADLVGLGATAALVSDRPRRGEHRFHIAFANAAGPDYTGVHCTCVLAKGRRDRAAEEDLVSRAIVLWLARACGVAAPSPRSLMDADEHYAEAVSADTSVAAVDKPADPIDRLLAGEVDRVTVQPDGQIMLSAPAPRLLFPGSFNPLHEGHLLLARVAEELRQQPLAFEISVTNVDKPPLAGETVRQRLSQFAWKSPVELTRAPTFLEKSRLFPGTTFVIGADTAERLVAPKYYGDDELRMHVALEEIANSGSSFLVAVRIDAVGRVRALNDIPVPRRYADLFTEIPEHRFRVDTSSSEIRARRRAGGNS
jgi:nicotinic acid mononucleotide adenylyltransferase